MRLSEIQEQAIREWESLQNSQRILIGTATCGRAAGALETLKAFEEELARHSVEATITEVGCMGLCYAEPLVTIIKPDYPNICYKNITSELVPRLVEDYLVNDDPCLDLALGTLEGGDGEAIYIPELLRFEKERRLVLSRCGYVDPENINHYLANGGYSALDKALQMNPDEVVAEITDSGLRGRGGAGFPTGKKWQFCRNTKDEPKYIICNADEGDPGAYMDRTILESDPHSVIEGMLIAGYAIGASQGYIYVRAEYPLAIRRLKVALAQAYESGLLGNNILDSDFGFGISIKQGSGAFVCGEETAMIMAIEGNRGMPYPRPPFPAIRGLWGKPTVINNVKTLANVPIIINHGADWYSQIGTEGSKGTAIFTLVGKVEDTGLAEVPMGTTLRELIFDIGGGIKDNKQFKAVQIGGPSGGCLPESLLDTPIDFDSLTQTGAMMGSGGMVTMDEDNCIVDTARFFLDFTQRESCGKCTMCRIGTKQMLMILDNIVQGEAKPEDIDLLIELAEDIKVGSLCGLGKTAPNPVLTTIRYFRDEYLAHIVEKRCPALVCPALIAYYILPDKCNKACDHCLVTCPTKAVFNTETGIKAIDQEKCVKCGTCKIVCPPEYDAVIKISPISLLPPTPQPPPQS
jgi:NADH-quinone oxidoreductase subunit F